MITIIDYGMGNLRSVSKAVEHLGAETKITSDVSEIEAAEKLILPGVGSFGDAMNELNDRGITSAIKKHVREKKPILGICLGLQLFFERSAESPDIEGLGILQGEILKFSSAQNKVPHMGWNTVSLKQHPLVDNVQNQSYFYFVHTFFAQPKNKDIVIGSCNYGDVTFAAIIGNGCVHATQFHPEKSQGQGLSILNNFIKL